MARWCAPRPRACPSPPPLPCLRGRARARVRAPPSLHGFACPSTHGRARRLRTGRICAPPCLHVLLSLRALVSHPPLAHCATRASRRPISPPLSSSPPRVCRYADNQEAEKDDFEEKVPPLPLPPLRLLFASPCSVPFAAAASVAVHAAHALPNLISRPHSSRRSRTSARPSSPRSTRSRAAPRAAAATSAATT